jgi:hypothetical protein
MFLGDFVEQLAATLHKQNIIMPYENEGPWHELFYHVKKSDWPGKPEFIQSLRFDWDGPYPKCQELSEFLHALHWNACVDARNPHFDMITLPDGMAEEWSRRAEQLDAGSKDFLERTAARARELFSDPAVSLR